MTQPASVDDKAKAILKSSWHFYKASFSELVRIFWLPFVLLALLKLYSIIHIKDVNLYYSLLLVQIVIAPWINAVAILFFYAKTNERSVNAWLLYQTALTYWPSLVIILFLIGGVGLIGVGLFRMGLWFMILPALWIVMRLTLSDMIYVLEKPSVVNTLKMSFDQTKNQLGLLLLCLVSVGFPMLLAKILILSVVQSLGNSIVLYFAIEVLSSFAFLIINIILYRVYMLTMENRTITNP